MSKQKNKYDNKITDDTEINRIIDLAIDKIKPTNLTKPAKQVKPALEQNNLEKHLIDHKNGVFKPYQPLIIDNLNNINADTRTDINTEINTEMVENIAYNALKQLEIADINSTDNISTDTDSISDDIHGSEDINSPVKITSSIEPDDLIVEKNLINKIDEVAKTDKKTNSEDKDIFDIENSFIDTDTDIQIDINAIKNKLKTYDKQSVSSSDFDDTTDDSLVEINTQTEI
jgi:hypothetical protein